MTARPLIFLVLVLFVSACSGAANTPSPTPTPVPPAPPPSYTVSGTVTATNGGQALSGLAVDLNGQPTTTNGAGAFTYTLTSGTSSRLTLTGAGILPRALTLNIGSARTIAIDAIGLGGGFDATFYRQLVRNTFDAPATMEPLRRWTSAPQIYLRTVDEAGAPIDGTTLDTTAQLIVDTAAGWTGNRFGVAGITRGVETRVGVAGWITVRWPAVNAADRRCGQSDIGLSGGAIDLYYKQGGGCRCDATAIRPLTVRHELGHAFGYWHTGAAGDLMSGLAIAGCDLLPSARERYHAAIAYARPVGNVDPDSDPTSTVTLAPMRVR